VTPFYGRKDPGGRSPALLFHTEEFMTVTPAEIAQTVEIGDIVVVKGLYLSPSLIVSAVNRPTDQAQVYWFDKGDQMRLGQLPIKDLVIRSKHTEKDLRLAS
jgi:hypothetical protein